MFLKRVLERNLTIPMFEIFTENYEKAFLQVREEPQYRDGEIATYIPPLALANPEWFASSFCSVDD